MGHLHQVKSPSKTVLNTLPISKDPKVSGEEAVVSSASTQSPTKFHFRHRTASEYQCSHSTSDRPPSHRRSRRRSISALPARRSASTLSEPEDYFKMTPASRLQICKEVLDLFVLVTDQKESPLRSSRSSSLDRAEALDLTALFKNNFWRNQESYGMEMGPSFAPDFNSLEWTRQRRLLDRELRRLLKWDFAFRHDEGKHLKFQAECDSQTTKKAEALFSRIGETLAKLLRDDSHIKRKVDRIEQLSKNDCSTATSTENVSQNERDDPLEIIKTAINHLFDLLHPLKRKRSTQLGHPISNLTSSDSRPSKIPTRPKGNIEVHGRSEIKGKEIARTEYPQSRPKVHFSLEGLHVNAYAEETSSLDKKAFTTFDENEQISEIHAEKRPNTANQGSSPGSKIIVKIADNPDAFQKASHDTKNSTSSAVTETAKPRIRRIFSSEVPIELLSNIDLEDPALLSERMANLSLVYRQFSPAAITNKLCDLAQVETKPVQCSESDGHAISQNLDPELSKPLYRLESILTLVMGFPDWQVFNRPGETHHSKSALSMIYFSLLEEISVCAVEFLHILQLRFEESQKVGSVKSDLRIFCACMRQLSVLNEGMDSQFQTFQPQLQRVIQKIEILDSKISPNCATGQEIVDLDEQTPPFECNTSLVARDSSCNPETNKSDLCFSFRKSSPLSLACFLSSADNVPTELPEDDVSGAFVTVKIRDLFERRV